MPTKTVSLPPQFNDAKTLDAVFARVSQKYPHRIAVSYGQTQLTYRELNERAEKLATSLLNIGVKRDQLIGLCLECTCDLIIGVLGILKAGGAYVPLDPAFPQERRKQITQLSTMDIVVADASTATHFEDLTVVDIAADVSVPNFLIEREFGDDETSLAYVIFTSGSSGQPKGVMVEHRNIVHLFTATHETFGFNANDIWCKFHSVAFDFSVWEIWGALLFGGRLVLVSNHTARDPQDFHDLLTREKVTVLNQTPSSFRNLIAIDTTRPCDELSLRYVILGGERLDAQTLTPWIARHGLDNPRLINMYGITETTVHATWKFLEPGDLMAREFSPIGTPIPGMKIEIADINGQTVPHGQHGLIYVHGAGLTRGYLGRSDLTDERFKYRTDHLGISGIWYNSGDVGVKIGIDAYAYISRADRQLNVRGYRIEPIEIETYLLRDAEVQDARIIAVDFGEGDPRLVAYIIPSAASENCNHEMLLTKLRAAAIKEFPSYMVPSRYITIDRIPTTLNGKQDNEALISLARGDFARPTESESPQSSKSIEQELYSIWTNVLGLDYINPHAEFFDLGGTSFSLIIMLQRVNLKFKTDLRIDIFSKGATLSTLIETLTKQQER